MMDLKKLKDPFPHSAVSWRIQGKPVQKNGAWYGMALAYIDARDVQDRLDEVCGPENWQSQFTETTRGRILCSLSIRVNNDWVTKTDGAGDTDVEGEKGAISDALKRAAVSWGIGRYLYATKAPWLKCECNEKDGKAYWKRWIDDPAKAAGLSLPDDDAASNLITAIETAKTSIGNASDVAALQAIWKGLPLSVQSDATVIKAKDDAKARLSTANNQAA